MSLPCFTNEQTADLEMVLADPLRQADEEDGVDINLFGEGDANSSLGGRIGGSDRRAPAPTSTAKTSGAAYFRFRPRIGTAMYSYFFLHRWRQQGCDCRCGRRQSAHSVDSEFLRRVLVGARRKKGGGLDFSLGLRISPAIRFAPNQATDWKRGCPSHGSRRVGPPRE